MVNFTTYLISRGSSCAYSVLLCGRRLSAAMLLIRQCSRHQCPALLQHELPTEPKHLEDGGSEATGAAKAAHWLLGHPGGRWQFPRITWKSEASCDRCAFETGVSGLRRVTAISRSLTAHSPLLHTDRFSSKAGCSLVLSHCLRSQGRQPHALLWEPLSKPRKRVNVSKMLRLTH